MLLYEPRTALEAIVVIDNVAAGPAIGGVRLSPDVTVEEVFRLARSMTLKNAMAGLPHGGAKSGIVADPHLPARDKERLACNLRVNVHTAVPLDRASDAFAGGILGKVLITR